MNRPMQFRASPIFFILVALLGLLACLCFFISLIFGNAPYMVFIIGVFVSICGVYFLINRPVIIEIKKDFLVELYSGIATYNIKKINLENVNSIFFDRVLGAPQQGVSTLDVIVFEVNYPLDRVAKNFERRGQIQVFLENRYKSREYVCWAPNSTSTNLQKIVEIACEKLQDAKRFV